MLERMAKENGTRMPLAPLAGGADQDAQGGEGGDEQVDPEAQQRQGLLSKLHLPFGHSHSSHEGGAQGGSGPGLSGQGGQGGGHGGSPGKGGAGQAAGTAPTHKRSISLMSILRSDSHIRRRFLVRC